MKKQIREAIVSLLANTLEYMVSARMLQHRVALLPAVQLTTMSTAANLLPIPGAFLDRVQGLRAPCRSSS